MQVPYAPYFVIAMVAAVSFAALHDLAQWAGRALAPWFGWMLP